MRVIEFTHNFNVRKSFDIDSITDQRNAEDYAESIEDRTGWRVGEYERPKMPMHRADFEREIDNSFYSATLDAWIEENIG